MCRGLLIAIFAAATGCGAEESYQPPRWVDGGARLRPTLMQCAWVGDTLEVALVAGLDRSFRGEADTEFLIGLVVREPGVDGERRIFGGWMDVRPLPTTFGAHPLDERMASSPAPGTDVNIDRATYATGHFGTAMPPEPYAFDGEVEVSTDGDRCAGRAEATKVIFGSRTEHVVFPFEGVIDFD